MTRSRKPYKKIKFEDRLTIERLNKQRKPVSEIAAIIGVNPATIYRELERGGDLYCAEMAQRAI